MPDAISNAETALSLTLAASIANARKSAGLSRQQLADASGVSANLIGSIERGAANPTLHTLARLAAATGTIIKIEFIRPQ